MLILKVKELAEVKRRLLILQSNTCMICHRNLKEMSSRNVCLDHNHENGMVRAVLCRSCNALEGKFYRLFIRYGLKKAGVDYQDFLFNMMRYVAFPETVMIHPKFKPKKQKVVKVDIYSRRKTNKPLFPKINRYEVGTVVDLDEVRYINGNNK